jgi:periplasmic glucans biosynthesis protein
MHIAMTRAWRIVLALCLFWEVTGRGQPVRVQVSFDFVLKQAQERSTKPFRSPRPDLPAVLRELKLDYDSYREIEFRHDKALWLKEELPFRLEFFHPGYLYQESVKIHEFNSTHAQPIRFVQDFFNYRNLKFDKTIPAETGYAGFRLLCHLNDTNRFDEFASFLGASYFRLLGKGQSYGQSARGLAINSGEGGVPEEFPIFTDWWIGKPEKQSDRLRLYAILDSMSCVGAYDFTIRPGDTTIADVEAAIFVREEKHVRAVATNHPLIKSFGMAPLTSMFWFGENTESKPDDYRPEVHDSDGLLIRLEDGGLQWRPLANPPTAQSHVFPAPNLRGFGLLQRDRNFANYQDIFHSYHLAPGVWVEPRGKWGEGQIHLVELPTRFEGADNIVAFWNPREKPLPSQSFRFAYTLHWGIEPDSSFSTNRVLQTRIGADPRDASKRQVVIDFDGRFTGIETGEPPQAVIQCGDNAVITDTQVFKNTVSKSWRVVFSLKPTAENQNPVDIQCRLVKGDQTISETWIYRWNPLSKNRPQ